MTDTPSPARARAEALFRTVRPVTPEKGMDAMSEYRAKQTAELDKMARLRAMRMAAKTKR